MPIKLVIADDQPQYWGSAFCLAATQKIWEHIAVHESDLLLLLGDMVYMDFSFASLTSEKPRGRSINYG